MESLIHNHYKNNLVIPGMKFYINGEYIEVLNVETEVNLNKKFNKEWDKTIIVDILATTELGYIVIEINYTHAKDWEDLIKYYSEINLIEVYEVIISEDPIIPPIWKSMNKLLKIEKEIPNDKYVENGLFYFGPNSKLYKVNENTYQVKCIYRLQHTGSQTRIVTLEFDLSDKFITKNRLQRCFGNITNMVQSKVDFIRISEKLYLCKSFFDPKISKPGKYDSKIYSNILQKLINMKPQQKMVKD